MSGERLSIPVAADEPTDIWDEDSLRDAGLDEILAQRAANRRALKDSKAPSAAPPPRPLATPATRRAPTTHAPPGAGLSWWLTIALALVVGAAVYFLVRYVR